MRSRYSAFHLGKIDYLIATLHPSKRQITDRESLAQTLSTTTWIGLRILATDGGTADESDGWVEFVASFREGGVAKQLHERSRFIQEDGRWFYLDGEYENLLPVPKPGRNDPCWCGSEKKYKKCHG